MKIFWKYCNHWQIVLTLVLMMGYSLDGVLISSIVVYAGKLSTHSSLTEVTLFGVCSLLAWGAIYTTNYFFSVNIASLVKTVNEILKQNLFWASFSKQNSERKGSKTISKLNNDMKLIEDNYLKNVFPIISNILLSVVSLVYILYLNIAVSLIFIVFSFLPMIIPALFGKKLDSSAQQWSNTNKSFVEEVKDMMQGAAILKLYGASVATLTRTKTKIIELEKSNYQLSKIQAFAGLLSDLLSGISFIVPLVAGIYIIVLGNSLTFSALIAIFLANDRIVGPIRQVAILMSQIKTTTKLRKDVISQIDDIFDIKQITNQKTYKLQKLVVQDIDFPINIHTELLINRSFSGLFKVLIYGDSGSGKTTFLRLVNGMEQPTRGNIFFIDDSGKIRQLKNNIAYIEQEPHIFNGTILDNITLFQHNKFSEDEVISVLKQVHLYDELGMSESLSRECGPEGALLSGGQKQRIEIARGLIRNKALYLVDEATANLDNKNADLIRDILFNLKQPVIEVAHHFDSGETRYTEKLLMEKGKLLDI